MSGFDLSTKIQLPIIHYTSHRLSTFGQIEFETVPKGRGGVLSFFLLTFVRARHLPFTRKNTRNFKHPPNNI